MGKFEAEENRQSSSKKESAGATEERTPAAPRAGK